MEKKKLQWETELSKAKEEQASTREKQNSFIDRVTDDVKQLRVKLAGLQDKHRRLGESHIHGLSQARETMSRKRSQARKQWEAEEKAYFEKVSEGKLEAMRKAAAEAISTPTGVRELLSEGIFISKNPSDRLNMLNTALPEVVKMDQILASAKKSKRALTVEEEQLVARVQALVNDIVQVDSFDKLGMEKRFGDEYVRPALRHTRFVTKEEVAEEEVKAIYP